MISDIDECTTGLYINDCPENSNCSNLDGSFTCGVKPIIELLEPGMKHTRQSIIVSDVSFFYRSRESLLPYWD